MPPPLSMFPAYKIEVDKISIIEAELLDNLGFIPSSPPHLTNSLFLWQSEKNCETSLIPLMFAKGQIL